MIVLRNPLLLFAKDSKMGHGSQKPFEKLWILMLRQEQTCFFLVGPFLTEFFERLLPRVPFCLHDWWRCHERVE